MGNPWDFFFHHLCLNLSVTHNFSPNFRRGNFYLRLLLFETWSILHSPHAPIIIMTAVMLMMIVPARNGQQMWQILWLEALSRVSFQFSLFLHTVVGSGEWGLGDCNWDWHWNGAGRLIRKTQEA